MPHLFFAILLQICTSFGENLRHLVVSGAKFLTNDCLKAIFNRHTNLATVDLSDCHSLTAHCLQPLAVQCRQLKRLILKDCHWVSKPSIEYIARHQNDLISINLTGCWELGDKVLVTLLSAHRK